MAVAAPAVEALQRGAAQEDSFLSPPPLLSSPRSASLTVSAPSPALLPAPSLTPHNQIYVPPNPELNVPNTTPRYGNHRHRCRRLSSPSSVDSRHRPRCPSSCWHSHSRRRHHSHRSRRSHYRSRSSGWRSPSTTGSETSGSYNGRYRSHAERRRSHRTPRAGTRWEQTLTPPVTDQAEIGAPVASHPRAHDRGHPSRAPSWADARGDTPYVPPRSTSQHRTIKTIEAGAPPSPGDARHQTQCSRIHPHPRAHDRGHPSRAPSWADARGDTPYVPPRSTSQHRTIKTIEAGAPPSPGDARHQTQCSRRHPRATALAAGTPSSSSWAGGQHQDSATAGARVPPSGDTRPASDSGSCRSTVRVVGHSFVYRARKRAKLRPGGIKFGFPNLEVN
ncbi:uncharacterized protein LOC143803870 [Ranitomeya variabilis]|uniref:uncharacterized protein LOC143803870 n=1 Tax=Ranitomeya variabilis TaxID=490064 RepID=UPI004056DA83